MNLVYAEVVELFSENGLRWAKCECLARLRKSRWNC